MRGDSMEYAKSIDYDCYAYFAVDSAVNMFPIKSAEEHLASILSLKQGDMIQINGLGLLQVREVVVTDYPWDKGEDKEYLYQEIAINVYKI
jgi:hypothetical protein